MENKTAPVSQKQDSGLVLKVLAAILPALIFTQDLSWLTANATSLVLFWVFWVVIILAVARTGKYEGLSRVFRFAEVGSFFAPVAVIIMSLILSSREGNSAVFMVMAGLMGTFITAIIALFFGFIFRSIANSFKKKAAGIVTTTDMKKCPDCAELIKADAKKCRYCGKVFDEPKAEAKSTS
jgi:hypothetical protein